MRPITDILREIRKGRAVDLASLRFAELIQAVDETGKPGELTITLKVKPEKGGGSQKTIIPVIKVKIPELDLAEGVFFSDAEGDVHRSDPAQKDIFEDTTRREPARA
jgi:hypothetical protein